MSMEAMDHGGGDCEGIAGLVWKGLSMEGAWRGRYNGGLRGL